MLKTGYISFIAETGGGFDSKGNVTASTKVLTPLVPANIATITKEFKSMVDGEYLQAAYSVVVDIKDIPTGLDINLVKQVALYDKDSVSFGQFRVHRVEKYSFTEKVQVVV